MKPNPSVSDQLYNWSLHECPFLRSITSKALFSGCPSCQAPEANTSWLPHRTLQTLWQTWMQMRSNPGTWTQILPVRELSRQEANNGLCAFGALTSGKPICEEPSASSRVARTNKSNQPRTLASQGSLLNTNACLHPQRFRFRAIKPGFCQHVAELRQGSATGCRLCASLIGSHHQHRQPDKLSRAQHRIKPTGSAL